jgi:hypothetical protein
MRLGVLRRRVSGYSVMTFFSPLAKAYVFGRIPKALRFDVALLVFQVSGHGCLKVS